MIEILIVAIIVAWLVSRAANSFVEEMHSVNRPTRGLPHPRYMEPPGPKSSRHQRAEWDNYPAALKRRSLAIHEAYLAKEKELEKRDK